MSERRDLALILALGLVLRLVALWLVDPTPPIGDEIEYESRARSLVEGREVPGAASRPPGAIWYYASWQRVLGVERAVARLGNVFAGVAAIGFIYLLGRRLVDRRTGLVAAGILALYPNLVLFSVSTWTETLYVALTTGALALLARDEEAGFLSLSVAGLVLGYATLTREVGVVLLPMGVLWIAWRFGFRSSKSWVRAAVFAFCFALPIIPWTVSINRGSGGEARGGARGSANHEAAGFVLITQTTYMNLYFGNAPGSDPNRPGGVFARKKEYRKFGRTPAEREAKAKGLALQQIRERMPAWPIEKVASEVPKLVSPNSFPIARLLARPPLEVSDSKEGDSTETDAKRRGGAQSRRAYQLRSDGTAFAWIRGAMAGGAVAAWIAVALLGTIGLVLAWDRPLTRLLLLFTLLHVIPPVVAFGSSRFRLPLVPVLILGAAVLLVGGRAAFASASRRRQGFALAAAALLAIVIAAGWGSLARPQWG